MAEHGDHGTPDGPDGGSTDTANQADRTTDDGDQADKTTDDSELPPSVVEEATRLTHLAREAVDPAEAEAYRAERERLVGAHDYEPRVREVDDTLVLFPSEWVDDGTVHPSTVDDTDRAVEVSLAGPGDPDVWEEVEAHNAAVVDRVREAGGEVHAANARAFADFMGNHYARPVESASAAEVREFLAEYFPRNAWPTDDQREAVEHSLALVFEVTETAAPRIERPGDDA